MGKGTRHPLLYRGLNTIRKGKTGQGNGTVPVLIFLRFCFAKGPRNSPPSQGVVVLPEGSRALSEG